MTKEDFDKLINRELDGIITPEEEAVLMDRVSQDPDLARDYRQQHALRNAFRSMDRPEAPEGLAERIADRVLAAPAHRRLLNWSYPLARRAALLLVILMLGGTAGYYLGRDHETVTAHAPSDPLVEELVKIGFSPDRAAHLQALRKPYLDRMRALGPTETTERQGLNDLMQGVLLQEMTPGERTLYRQHTGMSEEELERLLRLAEER